MIESKLCLLEYKDDYYQDSYLFGQFYLCIGLPQVYFTLWRFSCNFIIGIILCIVVCNISTLLRIVIMVQLLYNVKHSSRAVTLYRPGVH